MHDSSVDEPDWCLSLDSAVMFHGSSEGNSLSNCSNIPILWNSTANSTDLLSIDSEILGEKGLADNTDYNMHSPSITGEEHRWINGATFQSGEEDISFDEGPHVSQRLDCVELDICPCPQTQNPQQSSFTENRKSPFMISDPITESKIHFKTITAASKMNATHEG